MNHQRILGGIAALALTCLGSAEAAQQSVPVGYTTIAVPGNSDAVLAVPFNRETTAEVTVQSVAGPTINLVGSPLTAGEFDGGLFYVRLTSGARQGVWSTITANTANSLTVTSAGEIAGVAATDTLIVCAHETLSSIFADELANLSYLPSTSTLSSGRKTEVYEIVGDGTVLNRSANRTFFYHAGQWKQQAGGSPNADNVVFAPGRYLILRNKNNGTPLTVVSSGGVPAGRLAMPVVKPTSANDNPLTSGRPVDLSLYDLHLGGTTAFETSTSTLSSGRRDTLIVYDNSAATINKSALATYFFFNGTWRSTAATSVPIPETDKLVKAGYGFTVRTYPAGSATTNEWSGLATYASEIE